MSDFLNFLQQEFLPIGQKSFAVWLRNVTPRETRLRGKQNLSAFPDDFVNKPWGNRSKFVSYLLSYFVGFQLKAPLVSWPRYKPRSLGTSRQRLQLSLVYKPSGVHICPADISELRCCKLTEPQNCPSLMDKLSRLLTLVRLKYQSCIILRNNRKLVSNLHDVSWSDPETRYILFASTHKNRRKLAITMKLSKQEIPTRIVQACKIDILLLIRAAS